MPNVSALLFFAFLPLDAYYPIVQCGPKSDTPVLYIYFPIYVHRFNYFTKQFQVKVCLAIHYYIHVVSTEKFHMKTVRSNDKL